MDLIGAEELSAAMTKLLIITPTTPTSATFGKSEHKIGFILTLFVPIR
jgi:hypothetical protein